MERCTFCSNSLRLFCRTSAASLFSGSSGLGSCGRYGWGSTSPRGRSPTSPSPSAPAPTHQEEILQAINYGVYRKDWLPVLSVGREHHDQGLVSGKPPEALLGPDRSGPGHGTVRMGEASRRVQRRTDHGESQGQATRKKTWR